jgi:hypothetical protein
VGLPGDERAFKEAEFYSKSYSSIQPIRNSCISYFGWMKTYTSCGTSTADADEQATDIQDPTGSAKGPFVVRIDLKQLREQQDLADIASKCQKITTTPKNDSDDDSSDAESVSTDNDDLCFAHSVFPQLERSY